MKFQKNFPRMERKDTPGQNGYGRFFCRSSTAKVVLVLRNGNVLKSQKAYVHCTGEHCKGQSEVLSLSCSASFVLLTQESVLSRDQIHSQQPCKKRSVSR